MVLVSGASHDLVGRAALVTAVRRRIDSGARLLTLAGRHGVGKTRVALAVAEQLPAPVAVVGLDDAPDGAEYLARVLETLGLDENAEAAVVARLRERKHVVVLDGCRAAAVASCFVQSLLDQVAELTVVVTASDALGVPDEQVLAVPPLDLPPPDETDPAVIAASSAVTLFVHAAERAAPGLTLPDSDLPTVAEVCRRLDGLPQAIGLAAARLGLMQPAAMLAEMSRLGAWELVGLSVADEVARSIALLDEPTTHVLTALATMSGGAGLDAVIAVAGDVPERDVVDALALLVRLQLASADPVRARYALTWSATEHVRAGWATGPSRSEAVARHEEFFAEQARAFARRAHGSRMDRSWLLDHRNRLAALAALRARGDRRGALRLAVDCMTGFEHRGEPEAGRHLLAEVLSETPETSSGACIQAHLWLGRLEAERADGVRTAAARTHFESALRLARERGNLVIHLEVLNAICENQVVLEDGVRLCELAVEEGLELTSEPELDFGRSVFLCWHAANLHRRGQLADAAETIGEAMRIARTYGDRRLVMSFAIIHWQLPPEARDDSVSVPSLPELLEMADDQGDVRTKGWIWIVVVGTSIDDGDERGAAAHCLEMLRLSKGTQQRPLARQALVGTLRLLARRPEPVLSAMLAGALASHSEVIVAHLPPRWVDDLERSVAEARGALGDDAFDASHRAGGRLDLWDALDRAESWLVAMLDDAPPSGLTGVPVHPASSPGSEGPLTPRELQVLGALLAGSSNKEIARALGMRPKTVAHHCAAIYAKLGVRNRTEAVAEGLRSGLVQTDMRAG